MLERLLKKAQTVKEQTPLRELYSYFNFRRERIKYDVFIKKGYPQEKHRAQCAKFDKNYQLFLTKSVDIHLTPYLM